MKVLETTRVELRPVSGDDAAFMLELLNEPGFIRHVGDRGVRTLQQASEYIESSPVARFQKPGFGLWRVAAKPEGRPAGVCSLLQRKDVDDADLGFAFLPEYRSRGLATESAGEVLRYAMTDLGLRRVVAYVAPDNPASLRVLAKLGLRYERMIRLPGEAREVKLLATPGAPGGSAQPGRG